MIRRSFACVALTATALVIGCLDGATGPSCTPTRCAFGQVCVDYITGMSFGRQCITVEAADCDPNQCHCAIESACTSPTGVTCDQVDGGLYIANCLLKECTGNDLLESCR